MGDTHYIVLRQGGGWIFVTSLHFTTKKQPCLHYHKLLVSASFKHVWLHVSGQCVIAQKCMHVQTQKVKSVIEPSSSGKALELLLGTCLDRVQAANLLTAWSGIIGSEAHFSRSSQESEILYAIGRGTRQPPVGSG